jgi:hypothetical protein
MKTVIIGDLHGSSVWKLIVHLEKPDKIVMVGDYFDSFEISGLEQIHNFKEIIKYKEDNPQVEVVMLIGNHDHHYFPEVGYTGTSGYQSRIAPSINQVVDENRHHLQMAYSFDKYLFTHAGVSPVFMDEAFGENGWSKETIVEDLNELFKHKPKAFDFNGLEPTGDNACQTPIWIRPRSLIGVNKRHSKGLKNNYIQIVGHTQMKRLSVELSKQLTGGKYYFIDTMETTGEYLVHQDNKLKVNSVR